MCRYPQFFAANKLYENIKAHLRPEGDGKGGTYFGATGCGLSLIHIYAYEPNSTVAKAYAEFTKEVIADGRKKERLHSHEAR